MLHWLVGSCRVLGLDGQNWMLVIAGAFALYLAVNFGVSALKRRRHLL